jgi:hypothetical protein
MQETQARGSRIGIWVRSSQELSSVASRSYKERLRQYCRTGDGDGAMFITVKRYCGWEEINQC